MAAFWSLDTAVSCLFNIPATYLVYLRDQAATTFLCAATLIDKLQTKLDISCSHSVTTSGQPALDWPCYARHLAEQPVEGPLWSHWCDPVTERRVRSPCQGTGATQLIVCWPHYLVSCSIAESTPRWNRQVDELLCLWVNNNNNERISRAPFHVKHAPLHWTGTNTKIRHVNWVNQKKRKIIP